MVHPGFGRTRKERAGLYLDLANRIAENKDYGGAMEELKELIPFEWDQHVQAMLINALALLNVPPCQSASALLLITAAKLVLTENMDNAIEVIAKGLGFPKLHEEIVLTRLAAISSLGGGELDYHELLKEVE